MVNSGVFIRKNCNVSQDVTIRQTNRGPRKSYPIMGDRSDARVKRRVQIGNNVALVANCVVTKDVPDTSVVVGTPGKVI